MLHMISLSKARCINAIPPSIIAHHPKSHGPIICSPSHHVRRKTCVCIFHKGYNVKGRMLIVVVVMVVLVVVGYWIGLLIVVYETRTLTPIMIHASDT